MENEALEFGMVLKFDTVDVNFSILCILTSRFSISALQNYH